MPPPWPGNGRCLWEMATCEGEWARARALLHGIGCWPWILNQFYSDEQLRTVFERIRSWKLRFALEVPALKASGWGYDGKSLDAAGAFEQHRMFERRFVKAGMPRVDAFAMDEPLYAARHAGASTEAAPDARLRHGVAQTAEFIALIRRAYPRARVGDIEPYPALTFSEITGCVEALQAACRQRRAAGPDFLRLDVDWSLFSDRRDTGWHEVKRIEDFCRARRIGFSLIYWAADQPRLAAAGKGDEMTWRGGVLAMARAYHDAGGRPDQVVLESWLHTPQHAVPDTDPTTFTASLRDLCAELKIGAGRRAGGTL